MEPLGDQCYFLQVPVEIRQCIYDYVIRFDPPSEAAWSFPLTSKASVEIPNAKFSIPWVNLLLICKTISTEIKEYMDVRYLFEEENRTWALELTSIRPGRLAPLLWRQIPCYPDKAEILVATLSFPSGRVRFWGDGGPLPILSQLYQTLNLLVHYGPTLGRQNALSQPMRLKRVLVRVSIGSSEEDFNIHGFEDLCRFFQQAADTGVMWGYVDHFDVVGENAHHEDHIPVEYVEDAHVPEGWKGYGFDWGLTEKELIKPAKMYVKES